jgi:asparagine synthase (glutamine-hydrolysing)
VSVQAGVWNFDRKPVDRSLIAEFNASLRQQGPDGESCWADGSIALLYRPFHTTAESRQEKQPHITRRGFVLTWDGRLDNRDELMLKFRSHLEANPTDVALVGVAFDHWGTDCFRRISGDWAVSIWKPEQRELVFGVDYLAIRHIFYYAQTDRIWWSTDLAPLVLLAGTTFHIDDDYIAGYFAHDPDAHLTPYREIREVPPAHFIRVCDRGTCIERYWGFSPKTRIRYKTDAEYEEHFRHVFRQSVRRRLRSDSPILAELSGGLDSSSIVCMADDILSRDAVQPLPRLDTLSYYDKTEPNGDDWIYFPKVEEKRGRTGSHIDASKRRTSLIAMECPEFSALPGYIATERQLDKECAEVARSGGYRTLLSGIGGDEFLGGIPDPSAQLADLIVRFKFPSLAKQLTAWSMVKRRPWIHLLGQASSELLPPSLRQHVIKQVKVEPWVDAGFSKRHRLTSRLLDVNEYFGFLLPTRRSFVRGVTLMADRLAKWSPVFCTQEIRYPFLDQTLIEFLWSIPADQLLRPRERRSLMRRSLVNVVPQEILSRRTKQLGARTPIVALEKNLESLETIFDCPLISSLGYVKNARFLEELRAVRNGRDIHILAILKTISLELWLRDLKSRQLISVSALSQLDVASAAQSAAKTVPGIRASRTPDYPKKGGHYHDIQQA